jgi:hypothetical protein
MLVIHHNDPDGRCAAAIVHRVVKPDDGTGQYDFVELNYHNNEFRQILPGEAVYIVDYSFPVEVMDEILKVTENVVLIDHHKSTKERIEKYDGCFEHFCDFGEEGDPESGCSLAWTYFFEHEKVPPAVALIQDYDTWTHGFSPASTYFTIALNLFDCHPESTIWDDLFGMSKCPDYSVDDIVKIGRNCVEFRDQLAKVACDEFGFPAEFEGLSCFVVYESAMRSSKFFGDEIDHYDMCVIVVPTKDRCVIRLYSDGKTDVSEVAKRHGGGGHVGAGGFVTKEIPKEFLPGGQSDD